MTPSTNPTSRLSSAYIRDLAERVDELIERVRKLELKGYE